MGPSTALGTGRLGALVGGRCPRCRVGRIFRGRLAMEPKCAVCGLVFEREPGYFTGAMYVSYALALPVLVALYALIRWARSAWSFEAVLVTASVCLLAFVPAVFRYSRIVWIHLDRAIDAGP